MLGAILDATVLMSCISPIILVKSGFSCIIILLIT